MTNAAARRGVRWLGALPLWTAACASAGPVPRPAESARVPPRPAPSLSDEAEARTAGPPPEPVGPEAPSGPLDEAQVIARALLANRRVADAAEGVLSAGYSVAAAESDFQVRFFPRTDATVRGGTVTPVGGDLYAVGVDAEKRLENGTVVTLGPEVSLFDDTYTTALGASVRQPLLRGTDPEFVRAGVEAAEFSARSARRAHYRTSVDVVVAAVTTAYQVERQREVLELLERSAARLVGHVAAARARERAGLASSIDVYRAELQANQTQDRLDAAREGYETALDALRIVLAYDMDQPLELELGREFELVRITEQEAVGTALLSRIEVDDAEDALDDAMRRSRVAGHNTLPALDLVVDYTLFDSSEDFSDSTGLGSRSFGVSLVSSSDLARRAEEARFAQAQLNVSALRRGLDFQRDQIVREVRRALRGLERVEKRIALQGERIRKARGSLELARVKFSHGLADNFDVVQAEEELREAETGLATAEIDYVVGIYGLQAAMGTLLERPPGLAEAGS